MLTLPHEILQKCLFQILCLCRVHLLIETRKSHLKTKCLKGNTQKGVKLSAITVENVPSQCPSALLIQRMLQEPVLRQVLSRQITSSALCPNLILSEKN